MSAIRTTQSLLRRHGASTRLTQQLTHRPASSPQLQLQLQSRRYINVDSAPILYSAHADVVGARTGHIDGENLKVDLTMAKALGGTGDAGKTNPEELFAAGYGACFQSAMNASAAAMGIKMPTTKEDSVVRATVHLVGDMKKLDMGLRVKLEVRVKGLEKAELQKVVDRAKEVCPYSRATKGNVPTEVEVVQL